MVEFERKQKEELFIQNELVIATLRLRVFNAVLYSSYELLTDVHSDYLTDASRLVPSHDVQFAETRGETIDDDFYTKRAEAQFENDFATAKRLKTHGIVKTVRTQTIIPGHVEVFNPTNAIHKNVREQTTQWKNQITQPLPGYSQGQNGENIWIPGKVINHEETKKATLPDEITNMEREILDLRKRLRHTLEVS